MGIRVSPCCDEPKAARPARAPFKPAPGGMLRLIASWLVTGVLPARFGLSPAYTLVRGDLVPGSQADMLAFHDDWTVSAFAVMPDDPGRQDVQRAIDRVLATHEAALRPFDPAMAPELPSSQMVVVSPGPFSREHSEMCLDAEVSYIAAGCGSENAGALRWMSS